jgi:glycosyltransferase involved in cell wall biosynthesis
VLPRVFLLITKADIGGAQIHVLSLIKSLQHKIHFTLGCGESGYLTDQAKQLGIEVVVIAQLQRQISLTRDISSIGAVRNVLRRLKPDLLHAHSSKAGVIGRLAARSLGIKSLFTAHGWAFTEGAGPVQRSYGLIIEWTLARVGNGIITVSKYDQELAGRFKVRSRNGNWLVQNGVAQIQGKRALEKSGEIRLLNIGRMARAKNQKLLLEAVAKVERNFKLTIVGVGHFKTDLENMVRDLDLGDKVEFVGNAPDIGTLFQACHIFVLSSDYEGLPLSILEAMSAGLPVVATDVGGVKEAVVDGSTGFLVKRGDSKALGEKITALIDDHSLRQKYAEKGLERYNSYFRLEKMCDSTLHIFRELIG